MSLIRFFLLIILGLFIRRFWLSAKEAQRQAKETQRQAKEAQRQAKNTQWPNSGRSKGQSAHSAPKGKNSTSTRQRITEQEIDDADFEEIP